MLLYFVLLLPLLIHFSFRVMKHTTARDVKAVDFKVCSPGTLKSKTLNSIKMDYNMTVSDTASIAVNRPRRKTLSANCSNTKTSNTYLVPKSEAFHGTMTERPCKPRKGPLTRSSTICSNMQNVCLSDHSSKSLSVRARDRSINLHHACSPGFSSKSHSTQAGELSTDLHHACSPSKTVPVVFTNTATNFPARHSQWNAELDQALVNLVQKQTGSKINWLLVTEGWKALFPTSQLLRSSLKRRYYKLREILKADHTQTNRPLPAYWGSQEDQELLKLVNNNLDQNAKSQWSLIFDYYNAYANSVGVSCRTKVAI